MPRPVKTKGRSRLSLELHECVRERLEGLRHETSADSLTEVIRNALAVYDALISAARQSGDRVIIRKPDGTERELVLPVIRPAAERKS